MVRESDEMETIEMSHDIPAWAKQRVIPEDHSFVEVRRLHGQGRTQVQLPDLKALKVWAKSHGWPTPWFGFKKALLDKLFESNETYTLALNESGITIHIPITEHTLTMARIKELDAWYEERDDTGAFGARPTGWGSLVNELRKIRHLVEGGITVRVEETQTVLNTWESFYRWAHGRYHMLEDGYDSWIGDDLS